MLNHTETNIKVAGVTVNEAAARSDSERSTGMWFMHHESSIFDAVCSDCADDKEGLAVSSNRAHSCIL